MEPLIFNGIEVKTETLSVTQCAKVWKVHKQVIDDLVLKYGVKYGGPLRMWESDGGKITVNMYDIEKLFENNKEWPNDETEEEEEETIPDVPAPPKFNKKNATLIFTIKNDKAQIIETWAKEPTEEEIRASLGTGYFRVVTSFHHSPDIIISSKTYQIRDLNNPDSKSNSSELLEVFRLATSMNQPVNQQSDQSLEILKLQLNSLERYNEVLLSSLKDNNKRENTGLIEIISTIKTLKELGLFSGTEGESISSDNIRAIAEGLAMIGGVVTEKITEAKQHRPPQPPKLQAVTPGVIQQAAPGGNGTTALPLADGKTIGRNID